RKYQYMATVAPIRTATPRVEAQGTPASSTRGSAAVSTGAGSPRGTSWSDSPHLAQKSHLGRLRVPHSGQMRKLACRAVACFILSLGYTHEVPAPKEVPRHRAVGPPPPPSRGGGPWTEPTGRRPTRS